MPGIWLVSALFFLAGCFYGKTVFIGTILYLLFILLLFRKRLFYVGLLLLFSSLLWSAVGSFVHRNVPKSVREVIKPKTYFVVSGIVKSVDVVDSNRLYLQAKTISISGENFPFPYLLCVVKRGYSGWSYELVGSFLSMSVYFSGKNFYFIPEDGINIRPNPLVWVYALPYYVRKSLYSLLRFLSPEARSVVAAALLGVKDKMYYRLKGVFNNIGVGHILAISGLHLMIISTVLFLLLRALSLNYYVSLVIIGFFIFGYIQMVPESSSLLRAGIMYELWIISRLLKRNWSIYDILGLTVLIIFLMNPMQVFSLGFILSFTAVFSILLGFSLLKEHSIIDIWWVAIFASLGLAPIIIKNFGCFSLASWAITPLFVFSLALVLVLSILYILSFGFLMAGAINWVVKLMLKVANFINTNPLPICFSTVNNNYIYIYYIALLFMVLTVGILQMKES